MDTEESLTWDERRTKARNLATRANRAVHQQARTRPLVVLLVALLMGFILGRRNRQ